MFHCNSTDYAQQNQHTYAKMGGVGRRFPVTECFIDNITSFTLPVENASSQRFHKSICDHLSKLPKECPIQMRHSKVKLDKNLLYIAVRSVFVYEQVGQSVLIFLPGIC